ncbi:MAG: hypothetical protein ABW096_04065 [Candidatus Thiodiazotropha sp.]
MQINLFLKCPECGADFYPPNKNQRSQLLLNKGVTCIKCNKVSRLKEDTPFYIAKYGSLIVFLLVVLFLVMYSVTSNFFNIVSIIVLTAGAFSSIILVFALLATDIENQHSNMPNKDAQ